MPASVTVPASAAAAGHGVEGTHTYEYDVLGRRVKKTVGDAADRLRRAVRVRGAVGRAGTLRTGGSQAGICSQANMHQVTQVLLGPICIALRSDAQNRWSGVLWTAIIVLLSSTTLIGKWPRPLKLLFLALLAALWMFFGWIHSVADW